MVLQRNRKSKEILFNVSLLVGKGGGRGSGCGSNRKELNLNNLPELCLFNYSNFNCAKGGGDLCVSFG